jgi:signal transduction histidine kinase
MKLFRQKQENRHGASPQHAGEDVDPIAFNRFLLRFDDPEIERRYRAEHLRRSMPIVRLALLCGAILYGFFGTLDVYLIEQNLETALTIRFMLGVGTLAAAFGLTFTPVFARYGQLILSIAMINCGAGIVAMIAITGPPASNVYYAGLIMVIIYASTLIHLRTVYATAISLIFAAIYYFTITQINPLPTWAIVSNSFFLIMSIGVSIFSCYALEFGARQRFSRYVALEHASDIAIELKNEAISANNAKTEFLATMSHELRTPLNAVLGFSEILKSGLHGPLGSPKYVEYAGDIHDSAKHLLAIINDILDYAKTESGSFELHERDVSSLEIVERAARICHQLAASKGVRLSVERPVWTPIIHVDSRLFRQVIVNLLSNAIKFTPSAGQVSVTIEQAGGGACRISVADTGIGIAEEDQQRVFEPFAQVQNAFAREHGGTGLGLPLVRRIVEMHGGEVSLSSKLGEGTIVSIDLPPQRTTGFSEFGADAAQDIRQAS